MQTVELRPGDIEQNLQALLYYLEKARAYWQFSTEGRVFLINICLIKKRKKESFDRAVFE